MDLTAAVSGLQQAKGMSDVQTLVARKALDAQKAQGASAVQLIQSAGRGVPQAGDALAARATGLGGLVDTYA